MMKRVSILKHILLNLNFSNLKFKNEIFEILGIFKQRNIWSVKVVFVVAQ